MRQEVKEDLKSVHSRIDQVHMRFDQMGARLDQIMDMLVDLRR
jgi:hypothetical protein